MHTANGLFVDKGVPTGEGYLDTLARHYGTGVYPVDFQDEAATKPAIDAWVNQNTGGRIKKAPAKYDRRNTFSLLNAVYFAAAWKVPFDPADTSDLPFTTADGGEVSVPTMRAFRTCLRPGCRLAGGGPALCRGFRDAAGAAGCRGLQGPDRAGSRRRCPGP